MLLTVTRRWLARLLCSVILLPLHANSSISVAAVPKRPAALPQCTQVHLTAAYLAEADGPGRPGFLLRIINDGALPIALAKPFPTSAHWYARNAAGRWSWRASTGSGGALVDALRERGPVVAYPPETGGVAKELLNVPPHGSLEVVASMANIPILRFHPGCERCRNQGEDTYQAVLAYARLAEPGVENSRLLSCGLRSNMVIMPPLP